MLLPRIKHMKEEDGQRSVAVSCKPSFNVARLLASTRSSRRSPSRFDVTRYVFPLNEATLIIAKSDKSTQLGRSPQKPETLVFNLPPNTEFIFRLENLSLKLL